MKGLIMKKITLRIASLLAVLALLSAFAVPATAAKPEFMLALGDSITTGYGLDGYAETDPYECASYTNIVAEALGLEAKSTYVNKAVNGATSADLLKLLPDVENYLGYADLVVVTIGGNDLLGAVPLVATAIAGKSITSLEGSIEVLSAATPTQFAALSNNTGFQTKIGAVLTKYAVNLASIAAVIKQNAPTARVIFVKQYNPMKNVPGFGEFGNFADTLIASINSSIETVCATSGFEVLDAPSVIDVNAAALTNMPNYDIHPNADGHKEIAKLLTEYLNTVPFNPETEPVTEPETEPVTEPVTEAETTEALATETEGQLEAPGCMSSVSSAAIVIAFTAAFAVFKKKEN